MRGVVLASIAIALSAACGSDSTEITASTQGASPSAAPVTDENASTTVAGTSASLTTMEAPSPAAASCAPDALLAVVAGLFPENPEWNPTAVTVDACRAGYVQLVAVLDQSACPTEGVDCRDNQRAWLRDVDGVWTLLDIGTGIGCQPEDVSPSIEVACAALGAPLTTTTP
jgi:hypothetical protein